MAFARDVYTATASQTDFTITFPYEATADVTVFQNGTQLNTTQFSLPNATTVRLVTGATSGDAIVLERNTSRSTRSVDFTPGTLTESDLDGSAIQTFYMAQEAIDQVALGLKKASDEIWDATSTRIKNVADGTGDNDAVNLAQMNTAIAVATLGSLPSPLTVALGGTGAATAAAARVALGTPAVYNTKTTAPTATDDTSSGYVVGDLWIDVTNDVSYVALDVSASAAVWARVYGTVAHKFNATTAPGVTNDVDEGYGPGSFWIDTTADAAYVCLDGTDGAAVWTAIAGGPQRDTHGFSIANNGTDSAHDLDIGAGGCWDTTGVSFLSGSALTKQADAAWAVGTNAGMMDTGALANNTIYYIWAILKDSDNSVDYLCSLASAIASVTLPSGYTKGQIIGTFSTDGSANITQGKWKHRWFSLEDPVTEFNSSVTNDTLTAMTMTHAPPHCTVEVMVYYSDATASASVGVSLANPEHSGGTGQHQVGFILLTSGAFGVEGTGFAVTNASQQVKGGGVSSGGGTRTLQAYLRGYEDSWRFNGS